MTLRPPKRSRSQALKIWRQIAEGILHEPSKLSNGEPPSLEYYEAVEFLMQVATQVIAADTTRNSQKRSRDLMKAIHLHGKNNHDESALLKTIELIEEFGLPNPKKIGEQTAEVARSQIRFNALLEGRTCNVDLKEDPDILKQIRKHKKNKQGK